MLCYGDGHKVLEQERHHLWEDFSRKIRNSTRTLQKKPGDYFHDIAMTFIAIMAARIGLRPLFLPFHRKAKIISVYQIGTLSCLENRPVNIILNGIDFGIDSLFPSEIRNSDFLSSACVFACKIAPYSASCIFVQKQRKRRKEEKEKCAKCQMRVGVINVNVPRVSKEESAKSMPCVSG